MAGLRVENLGSKRCSTRFRLSISLNNRAAEDASQEVQHIGRDRRRSSDHDSHSATQSLLRLVEHNRVEHAIVRPAVGLVVVRLGVKTLVEEESVNERPVFHGCLHFFIYLIQKTWHANEYSWLQDD